MAILAALALLDAQHHAFGIDVGYRQRDDLGNAQPGAVGDTQRRLVLDARRRLQKARDLLGTQDDRHLARLVHVRQVLGEIGTIERHIEEESQRRDGGVDLRRACAARRQMQPEAAQPRERFSPLALSRPANLYGVSPLIEAERTYLALTNATGW
jgi:hypothetical protein